MPFLLVAVTGGFGVALLAGGRLAPILDTKLRRVPALLAAVAVQALLEVAFSQGNGAGSFLLGASYALLLWFCVANIALLGMGVVTLGIALNALVITVNGGMPVRTPPGVQVAETVKHHAERNDDLLVFLADIIVPRGLNQSLSFGDLILVVGLTDVLVHRSRSVPTDALTGRRRPFPLEPLPS